MWQRRQMPPNTVWPPAACVPGVGRGPADPGFQGEDDGRFDGAPCRGATSDACDGPGAGHDSDDGGPRRPAAPPGTPDRADGRQARACQRPFMRRLTARWALGLGRLDAIIAVLIVVLIALQYPLWIGPNGWKEVRRLEQAVRALELSLEQLDQRNRALAAEIDDLREGLDAVEERARRDLGLIRDGELFLFFIEPDETPARREPPR